MDLVLTPPQRGETCCLRWWVEDGQLVKYRDSIFEQRSDQRKNHPHRRGVDEQQGTKAEHCARGVKKVDLCSR